MKKVIFFILGVVIASHCFGDYTGRIRSKIVKAGWVGSSAKNSVILKGEKTEEWIAYYNGNVSRFVDTPERATFFEMTDFSQVQYPFWIKKVKNIFYRSGGNPWFTNQFKFKIYASDGQTVLYESVNLTAQDPPNETIHNLPDSVKIESGNFWLSVVPGHISSGSPFCVSDNVSQGHSFYDSSGVWASYSSGEYAKFAYVSWSVGVEEVSAKPKFKVEYSSNPIQDFGLILYELPTKTNVSIKLYDITGRVIKTIDKGIRNKGKHEIKLDTKELVSGIYFCKFEIGKESKTKKLILLK